MCSKQTPEESNIEEGEVTEELLAIIQEEDDYKEPTVDCNYYEPTVDSDSEFPWHHPENQIADFKINEPEINMSEFHNPWDIYRGNIPASSKQNEQTVDNYQDIRKHAWDYTHPHQTESHNYDQTFHSNEQKNNHASEYKDNIWHANHESSDSPNVNQMNTHHSDHYHQQPQHDTNSQYHNVSQYHHENTSTIQQSNYDQHKQEHNYSEPHHTHENHSNFKTSEDKNCIFNQSQNNESQVDSHVCQTHNLQDHEDYVGKKLNGFTSSAQFINQNRPQVYSVRMDHVKLNRHVPEEKMNGCVCLEDCDIYEEITPRHPYDDFYLRHRMTIDSRGRKICSHEIPFRPPSPLSESSEEFEDAIETFGEDITNKAINGEDSQTGVAGNLARVVPGAPLQQEAVDELARRQGWEAGNIDYMGADSFDNIWAKISHTLSQPSEQPEPPKEETQPEAAVDSPSVPAPIEAAVEPASEPAPVASAVESVTPQQVEAPEEKKVAVTSSEAAPVVVPTPVEPETTEKSPETAPVAPAKVPAVVEPTPVEVPVPVDEAPAPETETTEVAGKPEEIIPVPVEAAAVELAASASADVNSKTEPEVAEVPVAALEALKIDEAPSAAVAEATIEQAAPAPLSSVPEPTPALAEEPKTLEVAEKPAAASDSPPLANTPSKEEIPVAAAAKSEERRKPAGKLQLRPPLAADPALTPDSEAEDAAALATSIIAGELRTTVTGPTPPALSPSPASPPALSRLSVQEPAVPTPPVGAVSLSQIGIKSKPTTAAQIESSVKTDAASAEPAKTDPPKKKVVKKMVKKDKDGASSGEAPVPPPRKKEKKPKEA